MIALNNKIVILCFTLFFALLFFAVPFSSASAETSQPLTYAQYLDWLGFEPTDKFSPDVFQNLSFAYEINPSLARNTATLVPLSFSLGTGAYEDDNFYVHGIISTTFKSGAQYSPEKYGIMLRDGTQFYWGRYVVEGSRDYSTSYRYYFTYRVTVSCSMPETEIRQSIIDGYNFLFAVEVSPSSDYTSLSVVFTLANTGDLYDDNSLWSKRIPFTFKIESMGSATSVTAGTVYPLSFSASSTSGVFTYQTPISFFDNFYYVSRHGYDVYLDAISSGAAYDQGYSDGYSDGYKKANTTITNTSASYVAGYNNGIAKAGNYTFSSLLGAVIDVPLNAFTSMFNFEILGVNMTSFLTSLLVIALVLMVLKIVFSFI